MKVSIILLSASTFLPHVVANGSVAAADEAGEGRLPRSAAAYRRSSIGRNDPAKERQALHRSLVERMRKQGLLYTRVDVPAPGQEEMKNLQNEHTPQGTPKKIGFNMPARIPIIPDNKSDDEVVTTCVRARGAAGLKLHLSNFAAGDNDEVYVVTSSGEADGPYTGQGINNNGDMWTATTNGEEVCVQVHRGDSTKKGPVGFISGYGYLPPLAESDHGQNLRGRDLAFCSFNEPCIENAMCGTPNAAVDAAREAVASMVYASGRWLYTCTGGLIADTAQTGTQYFLTANHCISRRKEAGSLETFFDHTVGCNAQCNSGDQTWNGGVTGSTNGATILSTSSTSDYTLLQLNGNVGSRLFLGWNSDPVANTNGLELYRISNPVAGPQAYSEHVVDTSRPTCSSWPRGSWIYGSDTYGGTDGGSSGSPVLNGAGEVVGQLSGACGYNVNDPCDSASNAVVDGAFAAYFDQVSQWLDPPTGGPAPTPSPPSSTPPSTCDTTVTCNSLADCDSSCTKCVGGGPQGAKCKSG